MNKKTLITLTSIFILSLVVLPSVALAQNWGFQYATALQLGTTDIRESTMQIINVLMGFLGIVAIIIILLGGFKWMTAGGNDEKTGEARKLIFAGIVGLVIILASYAIASFVVTQLYTATGGAVAS